ncbi:MAG TPA: hypothetical protein VI160_10535, partial [Gemmatimonadales bacterium]
TAGCDKIKGFLTKKPQTPTTPTATHPAPADTAKQPGAPGAGPIRHPGPAAAAQHPQPPASLAAARPVRDTPYDSPDTGTVAPGMSERDVETLWGPPVSTRTMGAFTYLYYHNSCERSCGTADVVTLQDNKVVDAVVRWPGHVYSGQSSSPAATTPHARTHGDTLTVKHDSSR